MEPGITNPFNWVLFALPLRDGHIAPGALLWYWVLIHWIAAAFCFAGYGAAIPGARLPRRAAGGECGAVQRGAGS